MASLYLIGAETSLPGWMEEYSKDPENPPLPEWYKEYSQEPKFPWKTFFLLIGAGAGIGIVGIIAASRYYNSLKRKGRSDE